MCDCLRWLMLYANLLKSQTDDDNDEHPNALQMVSYSTVKERELQRQSITEKPSDTHNPHFFHGLENDRRSNKSSCLRFVPSAKNPYEGGKNVGPAGKQMSKLYLPPSRGNTYKIMFV